jgi:hypothetical protein
MKLMENVQSGTTPAELQYMESLITYRLNNYFYLEADDVLPVFPPLEQWQLPVANFIKENNLAQNEAVVLLTGLVPHLQPDLFDKVIESKIGSSGDFPGIGGVRGKELPLLFAYGRNGVVSSHR